MTHPDGNGPKRVTLLLNQCINRSVMGDETDPLGIFGKAESLLRSKFGFG
jgi:hypothetical protein